MTRPLDDEVEDNGSREMEAEARKALNPERFPPCYPIYLEIPL